MAENKIVYDSEYYLLHYKNGEKWEEEDRDLDARLSALKQKHGTPLNIIHIMWDDMAFGDLGIPAMAAIRGFEAPNIDRMASEGILFTRMYTEPSCTPSRAAAITGRHPIRNGMFAVGWPLEFGGLGGDEVTSASVLSASGYSTAFYSKWHLGDIEESYPYNHGFDEAFFCPYNQVASVWNPKGDAAGAAIGIAPELRKKYPYQLDEDALLPDGWVMTIEGKKGEQGHEWGDLTAESYDKIDLESERRMLDFIRKNAAAKKPFFITYWPLMVNLMPTPQKTTLQGGFHAEGLKRLDGFIGELMDELGRLGIAENTLIVAMADNGPMTHNPPPGMGLAETIFRGGKGDFTEGGVRVAAFAWGPGIIKPGQIVNDIIHETDLLTTFARLGGAMEHVPTDRVIDGVDQTALLMNGDTHGRRDYVFIYAGDILGATVKGRTKRHWVGAEGERSGVSAAFYDPLMDPREMSPLLVPLIHTSAQFNRMRARHELWMQKYPNKKKVRSVPFTGIANARPETREIVRRLEELRQQLPFDPLEYLDHLLPEQYLRVDVVD